MKMAAVILVPFLTLCGLLEPALCAQLSGVLELRDADVTLEASLGDGYFGNSVATVGDANGDGRDDIIVGAYGVDPSGAAYAIYTTDENMAVGTSIQIESASSKYMTGYGTSITGQSVSTAGDFNGDGFDDFLIGSSGAQVGENEWAGRTYLVYGRQQPGMGEINLSSADVVFEGADEDDVSGYSVACAGDVNGDGVSDLLIGAPGATVGGDYDVGKSYLIYGRSSNQIEGIFSLSNADVEFHGEHKFDRSGESVASAGDVNGDGFSDILIGAPGARRNGLPEAGTAYLIYGGGSANPLPRQLDLANSDAIFTSTSERDWVGYAIASGGDLNGDGLSEILISAPQGLSYDGPGEVYVFYGRTGFDTFAGEIAVSEADAIIRGAGLVDWFGFSLAAAGDVNGDGHGDILIGATEAGEPGDSPPGEAYLFYGQGGPLPFKGVSSALDADVTFRGRWRNDRTGVSVAAGDFNGDGLTDVLVGASEADDHGVSNPGAAYIYFGQRALVPEPTSISMSLFTLLIAALQRKTFQRRS